MSYFLLAVTLVVTLISLWKRSIVFSMSAALGWVALGIVLLTIPNLLGPYTLIDDPWFQVIAYLFFLMAAGCLLWYIGGIGKTKITMKDARGNTYQMWGKPDKGPTMSRSQKVKEAHRERLRKISRRYRR